MNVLITGLNGFVGRALAESMLSAGITVKGTVRSANKIRDIDSPVTEIFVTGEINSQTDWSEALQGIDVVIHLAAMVHIMKDRPGKQMDLYRQVNVSGTEHLAKQAVGAGVKRFIYLSSIKVNGERTGAALRFSEKDIPAPEGPYSLSKWEAEQLLQRLSQKTGLEVVIIRPPLVYGPGVKANFYRLMNWLAGGIPLPLGVINNKRSLVALENLVDLIVTCLKHPSAANQVFLAGDGEDLSTTELLRRLGAALGHPARLLPVSHRLLETGLKLLGKGAMAQRVCGSLQVDISKAKKVLGWTPPVSVDEGLRKTVEWYKGRVYEV